ncbi:hypothetical protein FGX56_00085, partial [Xylella fastidiosa subsp. multiplex]|nr:hypothetical protein [Xylella fastidiosa subsp. multiplex]
FVTPLSFQALSGQSTRTTLWVRRARHHGVLEDHHAFTGVELFKLVQRDLIAALDARLRLRLIRRRERA